MKKPVLVIDIFNLLLVKISEVDLFNAPEEIMSEHIIAVKSCSSEIQEPYTEELSKEFGGNSSLQSKISFYQLRPYAADFLRAL